jgi:hypothetical protein
MRIANRVLIVPIGVNDERERQRTDHMMSNCSDEPNCYPLNAGIGACIGQ